MKKRVLLKETEKMTVYQPALFFENQLIHARNKNLQRMLHSPVQPSCRLEEVSRFGGVIFLDDTYTSDIESLYYSLEKIKHPILWITYGGDSHVNYNSVLQLVVEKVKTIICLGKNNGSLKAAFAPYVDTIYECNSMGHAVKTAFYSADRDDAVLLSSVDDGSALCSGGESLSEMFRKSISEL